MTRHNLLSAFGFAAAIFGLFLLYRVFKEQDLAALVQALATVSISTILGTLVFTAASYACLASIEYIGMRYIGAAVSPYRIVMTSVAALGTGQTVGLAALSSGAIRYRMYARVGEDLVTIGKLVVFTGVTVALGLAAVGGSVLLWQDELFAGLLRISPTVVKILSALAIGITVIYVGFCAAHRSSIGIGRYRISLPNLWTASGQVLFGSLNLLCVAGALHVSLTGFIDIDYALSLSIYLGTDLSAVIAHVPGGWGVLEHIVVSVLNDHRALAGVLIFRAIYHFVPLGAGLSLFLADEARHIGKPKVKRVRKRRKLQRSPVVLGGDQS